MILGIIKERIILHFFETKVPPDLMAGFMLLVKDIYVSSVAA